MCFLLSYTGNSLECNHTPHHPPSKEVAGAVVEEVQVVVDAVVVIVGVDVAVIIHIEVLIPICLRLVMIQLSLDR